MATVDRAIVHEALEALYDKAALGAAALAQLLPGVAELESPLQRAEALRAALLEAIETLRPTRRASFGSLESRSYDVLTLRYVESMGFAQMERELSLGRRQIFRDLEEAEGKLADVLGAWEGMPATGEPPAATTDLLSSELLVLASAPAQLDLQATIAEAIDLLEPLAAQLGVAVKLTQPPQWPRATADRALLHQVLVQVLSCALQAAESGTEVSVAAVEPDGRPTVEIACQGELLPQLERRLADAQRIAAAQGIESSIGGSRGRVHIRLVLRSGSPARVLLIEDNPGAVELYRRYLSSSDWQVHAITDPRLAYDIARKMHPSIIVLDIMMPALDGWSVLRLLKRQPETADVPVVLCSIVDDPQLATALGARACLTKPVSEGEFLAALQRCLAKPTLD
ncbi:MAG: response regulator [Anaerolineae bacterium]